MKLEGIVTKEVDDSKYFCLFTPHNSPCGSYLYGFVRFFSSFLASSDTHVFCDHSDLWRMDFTISCDLFYMCISRYRFRLWSVSLEKGNSIKIK